MNLDCFGIPMSLTLYRKLSQETNLKDIKNLVIVIMRSIEKTGRGKDFYSQF